MLQLCHHHLQHHHHQHDHDIYIIITVSWGVPRMKMLNALQGQGSLHQKATTFESPGIQQKLPWLHLTAAVPTAAAGWDVG